MKLILFEGMPGSGKTTMGLRMYKVKSVPGYSAFIDEEEQDRVLFGDYWEEFDADYQDVICGYKRDWPAFLEKYSDKDVVMTDNLLLNQTRYLFALDAPEKSILDFFDFVISLLENFNPKMVFLDGDAGIIIPRVALQRENGWGNRVSTLFEKTPRQARLGQRGINGLVTFFRDSRNFSRDLLARWPYPVADIDVTEELYENSEEVISLFLELNS